MFRGLIILLEQRGLSIDGSGHLHLLCHVFKVGGVAYDIGLMLPVVWVEVGVGVADAALLLRGFGLLYHLKACCVCPDHGEACRFTPL